MMDTKENVLRKRLPILLGLSSTLGLSLHDIIDEMPKGSTPNKYTPHVGKKQIAKALRRMKGSK